MIIRSINQILRTISSEKKICINSIRNSIYIYIWINHDLWCCHYQIAAILFLNFFFYFNLFIIMVMMIFFYLKNSHLSSFYFHKHLIDNDLIEIKWIHFEFFFSLMMIMMKIINYHSQLYKSHSLLMARTDNIMIAQHIIIVSFCIYAYQCWWPFEIIVVVVVCQLHQK